MILGGFWMASALLVSEGEKGMFAIILPQRIISSIGLEVSFLKQ